MNLSICVVTMNRANQLKEALESCLACELPKDTEFVIIDNASTDNTENVVIDTLSNCGYSHYYERLPKNLGVGGGRNYAYEKASGEYTYMLDDDAVIDCENDTRFFVRAVEIMDSHREIATMTTQIYDTAWKANRMGISGPAIDQDLYKCMMFCGGSHFLRRSFYKSAPYLPNEYGYEEIPPSLRAIDSGKVNVFCTNLLVIHKPTVNKWNWNDEKNLELLIREISLKYAIKKMMYPRIFLPLVWLAYKMRFKKHLSGNFKAKQKSREIIDRTISLHQINYKIKIKTVISLYADHGMSIF